MATNYDSSWPTLESYDDGNGNKLLRAVYGDGEVQHPIRQSHNIIHEEDSVQIDADRAFTHVVTSTGTNTITLPGNWTEESFDAPSFVRAGDRVRFVNRTSGVLDRTTANDYEIASIAYNETPDETVLTMTGNLESENQSKSDGALELVTEYNRMRQVEIWTFQLKAKTLDTDGPIFDFAGQTSLQNGFTAAIGHDNSTTTNLSGIFIINDVVVQDKAGVSTVTITLTRRTKWVQVEEELEN